MSKWFLVVSFLVTCVMAFLACSYPMEAFLIIVGFFCLLVFGTVWFAVYTLLTELPNKKKEESL